MRGSLSTKPLKLKFEYDDIENIMELIQEIVDDISYPTVSTDIKVVLPRDQDCGTFIYKLQCVLNNKA